MESGLTEFCDVAWQRTLDAASVEALVKATSAVSAAPGPVDDIIATLRLPRVLIEEAVGFASQHADACLLSRKDLPSMPVPDPWDEKRKADLEARVRRSIGQVLRLAQKHWGFSKEHMDVSQCATVTDLLGDLASQWGKGQRAYHKALQKGDARSATKQQASTGKPTKTRRRKGGKTVEEALQELIGTEEGLREVLAAGTIERIRHLVGFSHGAVAGSVAWKKTIKPAIEYVRAQGKNARREDDDRRLDRRTDRRRK